MTFDVYYIKSIMDVISLAHPYISDVHTERIEGGGGGLPFSQPHSQAFPGGVAISSV